MGAVLIGSIRCLLMVDFVAKFADSSPLGLLQGGPPQRMLVFLPVEPLPEETQRQLLSHLTIRYGDYPLSFLHSFTVPCLCVAAGRKCPGVQDSVIFLAQFRVRRAPCLLDRECDPIFFAFSPTELPRWASDRNGGIRMSGLRLADVNERSPSVQPGQKQRHPTGGGRHGVVTRRWRCDVWGKAGLLREVWKGQCARGFEARRDVRRSHISRKYNVATEATRDECG